MGDSNSQISIRYVIVDDIDFAAKSGESYRVRMRPTEDVQEMVERIRQNNPSLLNIDLTAFRVLKILKPVPPETANPAYTPAVTKEHGRGVPFSLNVILKRLRERSEEANQTELTNEYVQILPYYSVLNNDFKNDAGTLISVILVQFTASGRSSPDVFDIHFDII